VVGQISKKPVTPFLVTLVTKKITNPNLSWFRHYRRHFFAFIFLEKYINKSNRVLSVIAVVV